MVRETLLRVSALLLLLAAVQACASREGQVVRVVNFPAAGCPWLGNSEATVLEIFGNPAQRDADGQGGMILTYRRIKSSVKVGSEQLFSPPNVANGATAATGPQNAVSPLPTTETIYEDLAEFRIDAARSVYRCWVDPRYDRKQDKEPRESFDKR